MTATLQGIEVLIRKGEYRRVVAEAVVGDYAIHQRIFGGEPVADGWAVTHIGSGLSVWAVAEFTDAIKVARWLDESHVFPAGREEMHTALQSMTGAARSDLMLKLSEIAPRMAPLW